MNIPRSLVLFALLGFLPTNTAWAAKSASFDFDYCVPTLSAGMNTPLDQTCGAWVSGHFSSTHDGWAGGGYSVQNYNTTFWVLHLFSGNYLVPNGLDPGALDVHFSQPLNRISFPFATADFNQNETPTTIQLDAYNDSTLVGSVQAHGKYASDTMPMGTLYFDSGAKAFNWVELWIPPQPLGSSDVLVDTLAVRKFSTGWAATGSMKTTRYGQGAALLSTGNVLQMGGMNASGAIVASAELYDPNAHTWAAAPNMTTARYAPTVTPLPGGKILVAGGGQGKKITPVSSAELYDPSTRKWTRTGSMNKARIGHVAVLLANGKVLVAGGCATASPCTPLASSEIYDPATGIWTSVAPMLSGRNGHSGTLLSGGQVLVAGGYNNTAETYDPATGIWSPTGTMNGSRGLHTATLLPSGKVLVAGGYGASGAVNTAELYDPATGLWSAAASMTGTRYSHTATLLGSGKVLVAGGMDANSLPVRGSELYNPNTGTWTSVGKMTVARDQHTAVLLGNGAVLVSGGTSGTGALKSAEVYTPAP